MSLFSLRTLVGVVAGSVLAASVTVPVQASTYSEFVGFTNSVLDGWESEKGRNAGFRAARALFNEPKYAQMDWSGAGLLCRYFRGDSTASGAAAAADAVWPVEKLLLDTFRDAGGAVYDWQDFMLVRFTVLSSAVNAQCPSYNSLMMGPFSDALYATFDKYRKSQGSGSTTTPQATTSPSMQADSLGTVTALTKPVFLRVENRGRYTNIYFPLPTQWDTWGITYTARFLNNDEVFCGWTAVVDQVGKDDFEGYCSGWRPKALNGKTRWMYIEASSDLGTVTSDAFKIKFPKRK